MAMLGNAAMLLWYDIVPERICAHDEWHTREHFGERVGIPGFLRAQRWVAEGSTAPRYFVSYEVRDVDVLTSPAYEACLNHPSEWTQRTMPYFRGMVRGFCRIEERHGGVLGAELLSLRYAPASDARPDLSQWLGSDALPAIAARPGFASAFMLRAAGEPPMTEEQRIRGRDATVDGVLLVTGYAGAMLDDLAEGDLAPAALEAHGALPGSRVGRYRLACRADAPAAAPG